VRKPPIFQIGAFRKETPVGVYDLTVGYTISPIGLLVHAHDDWPCAVCRPQELSESRGHCLCLHCARNLMTAAAMGADEARDLLPDIAQAITLLSVAPGEGPLAAA
jgi:hypothetical protein